MKIDQLPVEMLMEIFSYLPKYSELSQVNKRFYEIVCGENDSNICLRIDRQFFERFICVSEWLQSIHASKRQITKVEIEGFVDFSSSIQDQRRINSVLKTFSTTIKTLKLSRITTDQSALMEILSLTPNIECLDVQGNPLRIRDRSSNKQPRYDEVNLKYVTRLRTLFTYGAAEFVEVFNRLSVGGLTELQIFCNWNTLASVLSRQLNIKKLVLGEIGLCEGAKLDGLAMSVFSKLKLEALEILCCGNKNRDTLAEVLTNRDTLAEVLTKLTTLKSLVVTELVTVDDRVMNAITNLVQLEVLTVGVSKTTVASFENIRKLKKLQILNLECDGGDTEAKLRILAGSDNTALKKLSLTLNNRIRMSVDFIAALAQSTPNLTHIKFLRTVGLNRIEQDAIMEHFNFVEVLVIPAWEEPFADPKFSYFNSKLREFEVLIEVSGAFNKQDLTALIGAYPNLKKFKFSNYWFQPTASIQIRPLLNGFTKLESLNLNIPKLIVEDLNYLFDHKNNLKFVALGQLLKDTLSDEVVRKLRANFNVLHVENVSFGSSALNETLNLKMAVDKRTMNYETLDRPEYYGTSLKCDDFFQNSSLALSFAHYISGLR